MRAGSAKCWRAATAAEAHFISRQLIRDLSKLQQPVYMFPGLRLAPPPGLFLCTGSTPCPAQHWLQGAPGAGRRQGDEKGSLETSNRPPVCSSSKRLGAITGRLPIVALRRGATPLQFLIDLIKLYA